eukprot:3608048-Pyramimonas_sp.AAC.1
MGRLRGVGSCDRSRGRAAHVKALPVQRAPRPLGHPGGRRSRRFPPLAKGRLEATASLLGWLPRGLPR